MLCGEREKKKIKKNKEKDALAVHMRYKNIKDKKDIKGNIKI